MQGSQMVQSSLLMEGLSNLLIVNWMDTTDGTEWQPGNGRVTYVAGLGGVN